MENNIVSWQEVRHWVDLFKSILTHKGMITVESVNTFHRHGFYQKAKQFQTRDRNLLKALQFYAKAAIHSERINSSIKDFAAVLHQCGHTRQAIKFLRDLRKIYSGDMKKYDRLMQNFQIQVNPTGKHNYIKLLLDLREYSQKVKDEVSFMSVIFSNHSRIRLFQRFDCLSLKKQKKRGRYVLLTFDTFSAAKKTLQTFLQASWFGIDKYWVNIQNNIVAQAEDGRTDFERGIVLNGKNIQKIDGENCSEDFLIKQLTKLAQTAKDETELINLTALCLIQDFSHFQTMKTFGQILNPIYDKKNQKRQAKLNQFHW